MAEYELASGETVTVVEVEGWARVEIHAVRSAPGSVAASEKELRVWAHDGGGNKYGVRYYGPDDEIGVVEGMRDVALWVIEKVHGTPVFVGDWQPTEAMAAMLERQLSKARGW